ncbi:hypothetical protein Zmor_003690 [Zophobas morio]|uniref:Uncharacterized protein n=1 Tax=Zophobas morio TaxID=2755281 RepID=A0AA38M1H6_9CUCU|nr:hypothetical protein Zmor_003690 [Zophobas morio]
MKTTTSTHIILFCKICKGNLSSIAELSSKVMDMKKTIDDRLIAMEKVVSTRQLSPLQEEEIIQESVDRTLRIGNILLANVPEVKDVLDEKVANDILELIEPAAVESLENVSYR